MTKKILATSVVTVMMLSLVGCGGGSSAPANAEISTQKISGFGDDDLILDGIVSAKDTAGAVLATGRTNGTTGFYELSVAYTGMVVVNVTCDDNSTMWNPDTNVTVACGNDVDLNSLANVVSGVDQTVHISLLTDILYNRAVALAGNDESAMTTENFTESRSEMSQLFGVDPIADNPAEEGSASAAIIGAIHTLADEDNTTSVIDVTESLSDALVDGSAEGEQVLVDLARVSTEANITNNLTDSNGTFTPTPVEAVTAIEETKALFTELRTQAMSVVDYENSGTPGFLDTEVQNIDAALNSAVLNVAYMGDVLAEIVDGIGDAYEHNMITKSGHPMGAARLFTLQKTAAGVWSYTIAEDSTTWEGTVSFPESLVGEDGETELSATSGTLSANVNGTLPYDYKAVTDSSIIDSQSFEGTIAIVRKATGADITISGEVASNGTTLKLTTAKAEVAYTAPTNTAAGSTEPQFNYFKLNEVTLQAVVGAYTLDGSIVVNSYAQNNGLKNKGGFVETSTTYFGGQAYCGVVGYVNGSITITLADGSVVVVTTDMYGNYNGEIDGEHSFDDFENASMETGYAYDSTICSNGSTASASIYYTHSNSDSKLANSGWLPSKIAFTGAMSRTGASFNGTLNAEWLNAVTMDLESDDKPLVKVAFNGKLQMPDRPEMLATLSFENTATANTIGASYSYDATLVNLSGVFDSTMKNGNIEVTTGTGLLTELKISNGNLVVDGSGTVKKDNTLVGNLEERAGVPVIKYVDGSFESLP